MERFINKFNLARIRLDKMVQALVELDENINRVLNIVKAKYGLKDKGEAITLVVNEYIEFENEPELKPEFIAKMRRIEKQPTIKIKNFRKHFGLDKDV